MIYNTMMMFYTHVHTHVHSMKSERERERERGKIHKRRTNAVALSSGFALRKHHTRRTRESQEHRHDLRVSRFALDALSLSFSSRPAQL